MVSHGEIGVWRDNDVFPVNVGGKLGFPNWPDIWIEIGGRDAWEVIAICLPGVITVVQHVRFRKSRAIAIDHAIAQVDSIPWNSDDPFYDMQAGRLWREKYDDVAAPNVAVREQRRDPRALRSKPHAIHYEMIAHEQGVLHRTRWDRESLRDKNNDEQARYDDARRRRKKLNRRFFGLR